MRLLDAIAALPGYYGSVNHPAEELHDWCFGGVQSWCFGVLGLPTILLLSYVVVRSSVLCNKQRL